MAIVNRIEKKAQVSKGEVIQYQILTYCFFNNIQISLSDLNCLYSLSLMEGIELTTFCDKISELGIFKSSQSCSHCCSCSVGYCSSCNNTCQSCTVNCA